MFSLVLSSVFFGAWALVSVLALWPRLEARIRARDVLKLVPQWKFFAPTPNMSDFFVVYRDIYPNGTFTTWTELRSVPRHWWNALLFPAKRDRKSDLDTAVQLARTDSSGSRIDYVTSIPYLLILNRITGIERWVKPEATQFAVATINLGAANPSVKIYCVSGPHKIQ